MSWPLRFLGVAGLTMALLILITGLYACRQRSIGSYQQPLDDDVPDRSTVADTRNQVVFDQANHPDWPEINADQIAAAWEAIEADIIRLEQGEPL